MAVVDCRKMLGRIVGVNKFPLALMEGNSCGDSAMPASVTAFDFLDYDVEPNVFDWALAI
jgi:hypothetical protein